MIEFMFQAARVWRRVVQLVWHRDIGGLEEVRFETEFVEAHNPVIIALHVPLFRPFPAATGEIDAAAG